MGEKHKIVQIAIFPIIFVTDCRYSAGLRDQSRYEAPGDIRCKQKERIKRFKETRDNRCIYDNEPEKVCFQKDMAYCYYKDLLRRQVLHVKALTMVSNPQYNGYQHGLAPKV